MTEGNGKEEREGKETRDEGMKIEGRESGRKGGKRYRVDKKKGNGRKQEIKVWKGKKGGATKRSGRK